MGLLKLHNRKQALILKFSDEPSKHIQINTRGLDPWGSHYFKKSGFPSPENSKVGRTLNVVTGIAELRNGFQG